MLLPVNFPPLSATASLSSLIFEVVASLQRYMCVSCSLISLGRQQGVLFLHLLPTAHGWMFSGIYGSLTLRW
uniref:Uncharacterized protein n=1 Tax=Arundo donax TaxID=35708 RepID=A0A0A9E8I5_ARUDO